MNMRKRHFTGVGARYRVPADVLELMSRFSRLQRRRCRTGGAMGSDEAFETNYRPLLYLPFPGFRRKTGVCKYTPEQIEFADEQVRRVYPFNLERLTNFTRNCFRRNVWQVIGLCTRERDARPSDFLMCWTPDGARSLGEYVVGRTGGTGVAISLAYLYDIPVFNLQRNKDFIETLDWCVEREKELGLNFDRQTRTHYGKYTGEIWLPSK